MIHMNLQYFGGRGSGGGKSPSGSTVEKGLSLSELSKKTIDYNSIGLDYYAQQAAVETARAEIKSSPDYLGDNEILRGLQSRARNGNEIVSFDIYSYPDAKGTVEANIEYNQPDGNGGYTMKNRVRRIRVFRTGNR